MPDRTRIPMARPDRLVRGHITANAIGPLTMPDRAAIVDALVTIAATGPGARVGLQFGVDETSWRYDRTQLRAVCEAMVVVGKPLAADTIAEQLGRLADEMDLTIPLTWVIAGDYLVQLYEHSIGDGLLMLGLPEAVFAVAGGSSVPDWLAAAPVRNAVASAFLHTFGRHPAQVRSLLQSRTGTTSGTTAGAETVWEPDYAIAFSRGDASGNRSIREWSKSRGGRVSFTAAVMSLLGTALRAGGIAVSDDSTLVVDVRRYLPEGTVHTGNLITGIPLSGIDVADPVAIEAQIGRMLESGRPAASLAAGVAKHLAGRREEALPVTRAVPARAQVVMSNMGVSVALSNLPWRTASGEGDVLFTNRPIGPQEIGILAAVVGGNLHLTATFHANVFDRDAVNTALGLVTRAAPPLLV
jgi:hypothetical protein